MNIERGVRFHYDGDTRRLFAHRGDATPGGGASAEEPEASRQWNKIVPLLRDRPTHNRFRNDPFVRRSILHKIGLRNRSETTALVQTIISGLGSSDGNGHRQFKGTHQRLAARDILENFVNLDKVDPADLQRSYSDALHSKGVAKDMARVRSLYKVGQIIASRIPPTADAWKDIKDGWDKVTSEMKEKPDWLDPGEVTKQIPLELTERKKVIEVLTEQGVSPHDQKTINSMLHPPTPRGAAKDEPENLHLPIGIPGEQEKYETGVNKCWR